ncbi:sulfite exporter TauE/SafE family protein [Streptomyces sp. NPDC006197]|uniref:sulfite exporter TauE/SafE family protein n=1 Tax=Streptomyces sp. NPDC006197 TaxID=3156685 RepID=UPI0033AABBF9
MDVVTLMAIGLLTGATTVLFGFGGGFVAVPVVVWADAALGTAALPVATATSALVMVVNAAFATAVTPRPVLLALRGSGALLPLLAAGACAGAYASRFAPPALARWAFVAYTALTALDLLLRPGFLRTATPPGAEPARTPRPLPAAAGAPIGVVAAFLGVGGSVMTVPAMRRAGHPMRIATALANPLTLAVALPAVAVSLAASPPPAATGTGLVGLVDPYAAGALLLGALPVIAVLRRRPPRIPDRVHACAYLALLGLVALAMLLTGG